MRFSSLRVRLTLWVLGLLCLIQLLVSIIFFMAASQWLQDQIDRSLFVTATQIATVISEDGDQLEQRDINFQFNEGGVATQAFLSEQQFFVRLIDRTTGEIIETSSINDVPLTLDTQLTNNFYETIPLEQSDSIRIYTVALQQNQQFAIQVGVSLNGLIATQGQILRLLILAFGITAVCALLSGWFVGTRALIPIEGITRTAQEINAQDLNQRLDIQSSDDELQQLTQTFNDMLDRIQQAFHQQQQFTADAAHELRTPLSIMQTGLDVVLSQKRTADRYQASLESMREEVQRLSQLANTLLMLARADADELPIYKHKIDFSLLLETVIDQLSIVAEDKHIHVERLISPSIELYADEDRLIQVALNLLENALKYTPIGGTVRVKTNVTGINVQFSISNSGSKIPEKELKNIFDRFHRVDSSRNRSQGGFGLGLAISKQIIELHDGTIQALSDEDSGTQFTVILPTSEDHIDGDKQ